MIHSDFMLSSTGIRFSSSLSIPTTRCLHKTLVLIWGPPWENPDKAQGAPWRWTRLWLQPEQPTVPGTKHVLNKSLLREGGSRGRLESWEPSKDAPWYDLMTWPLEWSLFFLSWFFSVWYWFYYCVPHPHPNCSDLNTSWRLDSQDFFFYSPSIWPSSAWKIQTSTGVIWPLMT